MKRTGSVVDGDLRASQKQGGAIAPVDGFTLAMEGDPMRPQRRVSDQYRAVAMALALSDVLCVVLSLLAASALQSGWRSSSTSADFSLLLLAASVTWVAVFRSFGLYRVPGISAWDEFRGIISATSVGTSIILIGSVWMEQNGLSALLALTWVFALCLEFATRRLWRGHLRRLRKQEASAFRTLVVGTNDEAARLVRLLGARGSGFKPLGYVATSGPLGNANGLAVLGNVDQLEDAIRRHAADCLFVAVTDVSAEEMARVTRIARREDVDVKVSVNIPEALPSRITVQTVGDITALSLKPARLGLCQAATKRLLDVGVASVALLLALPVMLVVALAVRLTSSGPVLFRQERVTRGGRLFVIYKFRTMLQVFEGLHEAPVSDLSAPFFKMKDDPRVTRIGKFLRRYSLDELPQLWNVIRGDISLVGPRPLWSIQVDPTSEVFTSRHEVRTGLTGWWQVNGRSIVEDPEEALQMDLFYVENWSLGLDLFILLRSVGVVLRGRGAC